MNLQSVLQALYDCDISAGIRDEWDAGWQVRIEGAIKPLAANLREAAKWLNEQAMQRYRGLGYQSRLEQLNAAASKPDLSEALASLYNSVDRVGIHSAPGAGWDVTFNETKARISTLEEAVQWLRQCEPSRDGII